MSFQKQSGIAPILIILIIVGVLVGGGLVWYYQKTLQIISKPAPQISPLNETASWKTYRNEEYGFEVKYPQDWTLSKPFSNPAILFGIMINGKNDDAADVLISQITGIQDWNKKMQDKKEYFNELEPAAKVIMKEFNIQGQPAMQIDYLFSILNEESNKLIKTPESMLITFKNQYYYNLDCSNNTDKCSQILSTFKFISQ